MREYRDYVESQMEAIKKISEESILEFSVGLKNLFDHEGILWIIGNGGSATTSAHMATDLSKGVFSNIGQQTRAICLNEQLGINTAWINDSDPLFALSEIVSSLARKNDALCIVSGSGNSINVINAAERCKEYLNLPVYSLTGFEGGKLKPLSDYNINVESNDMQIIENTHLFVVHAIYKTLSEHFTCQV